MNEYILIMTLSLFQATGNAAQIQTAEFSEPANCIEAGVKWTESVEKNLTSGRIKTTFVCVRK